MRNMSQTENDHFVQNINWPTQVLLKQAMDKTGNKRWPIDQQKILCDQQISLSTVTVTGIQYFQDLF